MRSWQRAIALGGSLLLAGAIATFIAGSETNAAGQTSIDVAGILLVGVGGSLLATGLVSRLVSNHVFGIDVAAALEALRGASPLARSKQTLTVELTVVDGLVLATGKHEFDLEPSSRLPLPHDLSLYTDVGSSGGGFFSITEPNGNVLSGEKLDSSVQPHEGKQRFTKQYWFWHGHPSKFIVQTYARFRTTDRLIWTVEHISSDFELRIHDKRGSVKHACVKINHHRCEHIDRDNIRRMPDGGWEIVIDYLGEVLPYQGFELQWQE